MARYNDPLALTPLARFGIGAQKRQLLALVAVAALIERGRESDRERERERAQAGRRTRDTSLPSFQQAPVSPIEPSLQLTRRNMPCLGRPRMCVCVCVVGVASFKFKCVQDISHYRGVNARQHRDNLRGATSSGSPELHHQLQTQTSLISGYFTDTLMSGKPSQVSSQNSP